MKIKKLNQKGFSIFELLLILLILLILGAVGWYVWQSKQKADKNYNDAAQGAGDAQKSDKKKKEAAKPAADPTADWLTYSNKPGSFSFKYPKTWVQATHPDSCSPGIALFGANSKSVGVCASESFGQMSFFGGRGDAQDLADREMNNASYPGFQTEAVTINGVTGKKQTGSYQAVPDAVGGPKTGDKFVVYTFFTNGYVYSVRYAVNASYPDALSDFNTLVTKTFKFTP